MAAAAATAAILLLWDISASLSLQVDNHAHPSASCLATYRPTDNCRLLRTISAA